MNPLNINEALILLEDGNIIYTIFAKRKTFIKLKNNKYFISNSQLSLVYSKDDFTNEFKDNIFYLFEEESDIDPLKDAEYYSWKQ